MVDLGMYFKSRLRRFVGALDVGVRIRDSSRILMFLVRVFGGIFCEYLRYFGYEIDMVLFSESLLRNGRVG